MSEIRRQTQAIQEHYSQCKGLLFKKESLADKSLSLGSCKKEISLQKFCRRESKVIVRLKFVHIVYINNKSCQKLADDFKVFMVQYKDVTYCVTFCKETVTSP